MKKHPLNHLTIRSAVVRGPNTGNILACDLKREEENDPHAYVFKWDAGNFVESSANFDAHSICLISLPEPALIFVSPAGEYGVHYKGGSLAGDIFVNSQPETEKSRFGGIRSLSDIEGKAYAVGLRGMVYRLDDLKMWTRIDDGLPDSFNIQAIHGFESHDIYSVGRNGECWTFDGNKWTKRELPTNVNLTCVKCAGDGNVYITGHDGIMLCGRNDQWRIIDHEATKNDIWDIEWFKKGVYVSTLHNVFKLDGKQLEPVDFGNDSPNSCYQLSATKEIMWSIGEYDIMSFDGKRWVRIR